jgi:hypothetical protein
VNVRGHDPSGREDAPAVDTPRHGGYSGGMTEQQQSPSVTDDDGREPIRTVEIEGGEHIVGPEVHPAGQFSEVVRWRLPYGGNLVVRVEQDRRDVDLFRTVALVVNLRGSRADVLAGIEQHVRHVAEREVRRRGGSIDPLDHVAPTGDDWPALWAHLHEAYAAYARVHPAATGLPAEQLMMMRAERHARDGMYEAAYREFLNGWRAADEHRRYLADDAALWGW